MATSVPVLPPPAQVAQEAVVQQKNAPEAPFASAKAPELRTDALDEAMPDADATAAREPEAIEQQLNGPATVPQQDGISASAAADRVEQHTQPAEPPPAKSAPTPMEADPTPPTGITSAPGSAEEAAAAAATEAPPAQANGVSAAVREADAPVALPKEPASASAAAARMNGTATANGTSSTAGPAAKAAAAVDSDSEDDVPLARRVVTPPSKPYKSGAQPSQTA